MHLITATRGPSPGQTSTGLRSFEIGNSRWTLIHSIKLLSLVWPGYSAESRRRRAVGSDITGFGDARVIRDDSSNTRMTYRLGWAAWQGAREEKQSLG